MSDINEIKQALTKITQGYWVHYSGKLRKEFPTKINEVQTSSGGTVVPWTGFDACSVSKKEIIHNAKFIANAPTWISSLITTIESQRLEIVDKDEHIRALRIAKEHEIECHAKTCFEHQDQIIEKDTLIESQKEEINRLNGLNIMRQSCIEHQDKQLGSLEAITELAVKGLEEIKNYKHFPDDIYGHSFQAIQRISANKLISIERLQNG